MRYFKIGDEVLDCQEDFVSRLWVCKPWRLAMRWPLKPVAVLDTASSKGEDTRSLIEDVRRDILIE